MLPEKNFKTRLSLVAGKHVHEPNVVLVPADAKTFPVTVEWSLQPEDGYVVCSHHPDEAHRWCVLDDDLKQVLHGAFKGGRAPSKKVEPVVSRTLHGDGENLRQITLQFTSARLRNGASYTLIASRHGVIAAGEFVAVREPRLRAAKRAKRAPAKTKKAPSKAKKAPSKGGRRVAARKSAA